MRLKKLWKNRENTYERNSREIIKRKPNANIGLPTNKTVSQLHKKMPTLALQNQLKTFLHDLTDKLYKQMSFC